MINPLDIIRKYYMLDSLAGQSLLIHSQLVRDKAQSLAIRHPEMDLDIPFIQEAAMLRDIGIFFFFLLSYFYIHSTLYSFVSNGSTAANIPTSATVT